MEKFMTTHQGAPLAQQTPEGPQSGSRGRALLVALVVVAVAGFAIYSGIRSRAQAEAKLVQVTHAAAVPAVAVVYPTLGSAHQEIALPGSTQAYIDTPIYARTSGYL